MTATLSLDTIGFAVRNFFRNRDRKEEPPRLNSAWINSENADSLICLFAQVSQSARASFASFPIAPTSRRELCLRVRFDPQNNDTFFLAIFPQRQRNAIPRVEFAVGIIIGSILYVHVVLTRSLQGWSLTTRSLDLWKDVNESSRSCLRSRENVSPGSCNLSVYKLRSYACSVALRLISSVDEKHVIVFYRP